LLAVVPIPGTGTSLAIVGYAITNDAITSDAAMIDAATSDAAMIDAATGDAATSGPKGRPAKSDPAARHRADGGFRLDHLQRRVWAGGREIMLTFQEFQLLAFFTAHPSTVFSRADLVEQVWRRDIARVGRDATRVGRDTTRDARTVAQDSRTVDVHVSRLRRKLGPVYGECLVTEYRVGYQFRLPAA
jgi:DNA-binding response OmpR family regulator